MGTSTQVRISRRIAFVAVSAALLLSMSSPFPGAQAQDIARSKKDPADFTLNPLPDSVNLDPKLFKVSLIGTAPDGAGDGTVWYGANGDLDGDGYPEVAMAGWNAQGASSMPLFVFSALKSGTVMDDTSKLLGQNQVSGTAILRIADVNGDGKNDLVVFGHNETPTEPTQNYFFISKPHGGFTASNPSPMVAAHEGEIGDLDGDGLPDFATATYATGNPGLPAGAYTIPPLSDGGCGVLVLWMNKGKGTFSPLPLAWDHSYDDVKNGVPNNEWCGGSAAAIADFDGDGKAEVAIADYPGTMNNWTRGDSWLISDIQLGDVTAYGQIAALPTPYFEQKKYASMKSFKGAEKSHDVQVIVTDFNNDGKPDILVDSTIWDPNETFGAGITQFLQNQGKLKFKDVTNDVLYNFYVGRDDGGHETDQIDVNGDGYPDLVLPGECLDISVTHQWHFGQGTQAICAKKSWSNDILINTGAGKFVSVGWSAMHALSQQENKIFVKLGESDQPYNLNDRRMFPYVLPDGRVGFVTVQEGYSAQGATLYFFDIRPKTPISTGPGGIDPATKGVPGFNEAYYLTEYPAVAQAVLNGQWTSGLDEYIHEGQAQGNHPCANWQNNCAAVHRIARHH